MPRPTPWMPLYRFLGSLAILAAGCKYSPGADSADASGDGPPGDGTLPDSGPCQVADEKTCVGNELRTCTTIGETPTPTTCGWGCSEQGGAHCLEITPTGGAAQTTDLTPATLVALDAVEIPADTIMNSDADSIDPPLAMGYAFSETTTGVLAGIYHFEALTIKGPLKIEGTQSIILVANGPIVIEGVIDTQSCNVGGTGVQTQGPGGFRGGNRDQAAAGSGAGGRAGGNNGGGGGGGHGAMGGPGGDPAGTGGPAFGDEAVMMLIGGGGGGGARGAGGGAGGGGGAAVQLISNTSITIAASGGINAGGCGGGPGGQGGNDGGAGGGAGGVIVLEAPTITINGSLAVNGGGGGGSNIGGIGGNGRLDRDQAMGGTQGNGTSTGAAGGLGAAGSVLTGGTGATATLSSGGGGAIGRMRFNVRTPADLTIADPQKLSPNLEDVDTTTTVGTATVN